MITKAAAGKIARAARRYGYYDHGHGRCEITSSECREPVIGTRRWVGVSPPRQQTPAAALDEAMTTHLTQGWCATHPEN